MELPENELILTGNSVGIEWSAIILPKGGEDVSGDLFLVNNYRDKVLIAVIDGLGHGERALQVSKKAIELMQPFTNESLISIINNCHTNLRMTRGVVMNLAAIDCWDNTLTWTGVGNVEGILYRTDDKEHLGSENIVVRGGVVGYKLPLLKASMVPISPGDTLVFTTDGVNLNYMNEVDIEKSPKEIVSYIASNYVDRKDDALILAARYIGINI